MPVETATNPSSAGPFALDPWVDAGKLAPIFARTGRMHIPRVLAPAGAEALHRHLSQELPWSLVVSAVAPFAPAARYSITGWLRAR